MLWRRRGWIFLLGYNLLFLAITIVHYVDPGSSKPLFMALVVSWLLASPAAAIVALRKRHLLTGFNALSAIGFFVLILIFHESDKIPSGMTLSLIVMAILSAIPSTIHLAYKLSKPDVVTLGCNAHRIEQSNEGSA